MSDVTELKAQPREKSGKGAARALRRTAMVPGVIYGDKKDPVSIALPYKELALLINKGGFLNTVVSLDIDGNQHRVLPKAVQQDPVRDFFTHVDFLRIGKNTKVVVEIPVHYINEEECPGIQRGGVLNVVRYTLEVSCSANAIPEYFEVDLTGLEIEDVVHASKITLPEGVELTVTDRDPTMCSIAAPTVAEETEEADEEALEGEEEATADGAAEAGDGEGEGDADKA